MRPVHLLWIAVVLALAACLGVWHLIGAGGSSSSLAAGPQAFGPGSERDTSALEQLGSEDAARAGSNGESRAVPEIDFVSESAANGVEELEPLVGVHGRVLDGQGNPVALAKVWATTESSWVRLPLDVEPDGVWSSWLDSETIETDEDGVFVFEELESGPLRLAVRASGFSPYDQETWNIPPYEGDHALPDVTLEPGVMLLGRAHDLNGDPVAGAKVVRMLDRASSAVVLPGRGVQVDVTDAEGSFRVDCLAPGPWRLVVDSPDHRLAELAGRTERVGEVVENLEALLESGLSISGKVLDADPALFETLRITARISTKGDDEGEPGTSDVAKSRGRHTGCDAEGNFLLSGLEAYENYRLTAWEQGGEDGEYKRQREIGSEVVQAGTKGVELTYEARASLSFQVLDDATGQPLTEFGVWAGEGRFRALYVDSEIVRHHEDGRVFYDNLRLRDAAKSVYLRVIANGYQIYEDKNLRVAKGEAMDLGVIRLERAEVLTVTVRDAQTQALVEGALVLISEKERGNLRNYVRDAKPESLLNNDKYLSTRTDATGTATLSCRSGESGWLVCVADGYVAYGADKLEFPIGGAFEHEVALTRGGSVRVTVTGESSEPVVGVHIQHREPDVEIDQEEWLYDEENWGEVTDGAGEVSFDALEPGVHAFRLNDNQGQMVWIDSEEGESVLEWEEVVIVEGREVEIEFHAPTRVPFAGRVTEAGIALEGASVKLTPNEVGPSRHFWSGPKDPLTTRTDVDGRFAYESLRAGSYRLYVTHDTRNMPHMWEVVVGPHSEEALIDLAVSMIEGRVTSPGGEALEGIKIAVRPRQGNLMSQAPQEMVLKESDQGAMSVSYQQRSQGSIKTDSTGRYSVRGVASDIELRVVASGDLVLPRSSEALELTPGEWRRDVNFELEASGAIDMELIGKPPGSREWGSYRVQATLMPTEGEEEPKKPATKRSSLSTWRTRRTISSVKAGRWRLELRDRRGQGEALQVQFTEVRVGEHSQVVFRF